MNKLNPKWILVTSLIGGLGGWMITLASWGDALTPQNVGGLLLIWASVVATGLGGSLIKPKG